MDPLLEHLHNAKQQRVSETPATRERVTESIAALLLVVVVAAMWIASSPAAPASWWTVVGLIVLYAVVWQVTFEVGAGTTTPLQLVFVPMWFAVEPAQLPLVVAAGQILGNALASLREREEQNWGRVLIGFPDSWYAVGPALVLLAFGWGPPTLEDAPIYLLALGAQALVDVATGMARESAASGLRPSLQVRVMVWITGVDYALAPIGLLAAIAMADHPWAFLAVVPTVALLAQFAKERDDRIAKALELSHAYRGTAQLMGDVLEADDEYTGGEHTQGVVEMALEVGHELGLDPRQCRDLEFGSLLHDIGKLRVPNEIINKPGKLNDEEWAIIKMHPEWGQEMLDRVGGVLSDAGIIVRAHHERYDGGGYPDGLAGDAIPIEARIITVCDSFSAMTTDRSYRKGMSRDEAFAELERCTPGQFDPEVVRAMVRVLGAGPTAPAHGHRRSDLAALTVDSDAESGVTGPPTDEAMRSTGAPVVSIVSLARPLAPRSQDESAKTNARSA
ncbi:MAG: HD-GYP domain-containing protein [Solirubrobacteraceae bacterium]|nr:HD-GYP domain-containing protein [Solirubrobacteraceae bacterium]